MGQGVLVSCVYDCITSRVFIGLKCMYYLMDGLVICWALLMPHMCKFVHVDSRCGTVNFAIEAYCANWVWAGDWPEGDFR